MGFVAGGYAQHDRRLAFAVNAALQRGAGGFAMVLRDVARDEAVKTRLALLVPLLSLG